MITSTSNAAVKNVVNLSKKTKERNAQGLFIVEGPKMFAEAPEGLLESVYIAESFFRERKSFLKEHERKLDAVPVQVVSDHVCSVMSDTKTPQGIICLARQMRYSCADLAAGPAPLCVILEDLQDPGNMGTIIRTAEGAGASGVLLSAGCVDIYNPKVIRSTMGSVYRVPFAAAEDLAPVLEEWKAGGMTLYAAHLDGRGSYDREDYSASTGFLIGNESRGLTPALTAQADVLVRIPMCGRVESLNASVAAAILMYEGFRQRRQMDA